MSIYILTGKTGVGKTHYLAYLSRQALLAGIRVYSNIKIYPDKMRILAKGMKNEDIEGDILNEQDRKNPKKKIIYWANRSDWNYFEKGFVFCQEGLGYFNSRNWDNLPYDLQMKFVQNRKDKIDIIIDIQHFMFIDVTLRRLAEKIFVMDLLTGSRKLKSNTGYVPRIANIKAYNPITLERAEKANVDPTMGGKKGTFTEKFMEDYSELYWVSGGELLPKWFNRRLWYYNSAEQVLPPRPDPLLHIRRQCPECGVITTKHV